MHIASTSLILFSALVTICETIPTFRATSPSIWFGEHVILISPWHSSNFVIPGIESSIVVLFTIEYLARAVAWSVSWSVFWRWALCKFARSMIAASSDQNSQHSLALWTSWLLHLITLNYFSGSIRRSCFDSPSSVPFGFSACFARSEQTTPSLCTSS